MATTWLTLLAVLAILASSGAMTWVAMKATPGHPDGEGAAIARMRAAGTWDGFTRATLLDTGERGFLAHHADRIGFFPITSADDLVIARSAISLIEAIADHAVAQHRLMIVWIDQRVQTRTFDAGPDLSPWTREKRPTVRVLRDDDDIGN